MPRRLAVPKTANSLSMTCEAWAILHQRARRAGIPKSDYVENLVRRGDLEIYDIVVTFLRQHLEQATQDKEAALTLVQRLEVRETELKYMLRQIGVNPNLIP